ncbi:MAG: hypothetical protein H0T79_18010, partial [Deltaproteobacteria bacterium]|nr:hypothetical protein [Deltaproteobacteria bacterium]
TYRSYFWTRSSASGRFIAHGVAGVAGSYIIDLQRTDNPATAADETLVPIANTQYDPSFFPDDGGFMFQGGTVGAKNNTCAMSVLTSNPAAVSMTEVGCTVSTTVGLYQHVGRALDGDSFAIDSQFTNDNGPGATNNGPGYDADATVPGAELDPRTEFSSRGRIDFTPLMFDGTRYVPRPMVHLDTPYEGDTVLSPSARLVMSRVADPIDRQLGYVLRRVDATQAGNSYMIEVPEIARYCIKGAKPSFSFDERYVVYHHYVGNTPADAIELGFTGTSDPGFQPYLQDGAANLYLMELTTGVTRRLTSMHPGQFALFPHFRSDGWIYADVRDRNTDHEYMIAHDGALILEQ